MKKSYDRASHSSHDLNPLKYSLIHSFSDLEISNKQIIDILLYSLFPLALEVLYLALFIVYRSFQFLNGLRENLYYLSITNLRFGDIIKCPISKSLPDQWELPKSAEHDHERTL